MEAHWEGDANTGCVEGMGESDETQDKEDEDV